MTIFEEVTQVAYPYPIGLIGVHKAAYDEDQEKERQELQECLDHLVALRSDLDYNTALSGHFYEELESEIDRIKGLLS
jgi:hypothetical protein